MNSRRVIVEAEKPLPRDERLLAVNTLERHLRFTISATLDTERRCVNFPSTTSSLRHLPTLYHRR
jgi:hypothetical protein